MPTTSRHPLMSNPLVEDGTYLIHAAPIWTTWIGPWINTAHHSYVPTHFLDSDVALTALGNSLILSFPQN